MQVLAILLILSAQVLAQGNRLTTMTARPYYDELRALASLSPLVTQVCFFDGSSDRFDVIGFTREFTEIAKAKSVKLDATEDKYSGSDSLLLQMYDKGVKTAESMLQHDPVDRNNWSENLSSPGISYRLQATISPSGQYRRIVSVNDKIVPGDDRSGRCEPIP